MNKYLLLRDNKQSGPYTIPEIIAKGLKPYDLVWLEGKSAAWRYPSEVEELKAYAPAVEEQPFDRFYKKPEQEKEKAVHPEKRSPFEPVIAEETVRRKIDGIPGKVYINFPGGARKTTPAYQEQKPVEIPAMPAAVHLNGYHETTSAPPLAGPAPVAAAADKKLLNAVIIACCVLVLIISVLIINYGNQRSNLRQLSDMMQQMEQRQQAENQSAKAALASRTLPAHFAGDDPAPSSEIIPAGEPATIPGNSKHAAKAEALPSGSSPESATPAPAQQAAAAAEKTKSAAGPQYTASEDLTRLVSVHANQYRTGILGGISNLQFVLTNNSSQELQRVAIEVKYLNRDKKVVKTQTVFFEHVAPGSQPILDVPKTSRGVSIDYSITDIQS